MASDGRQTPPASNYRSARFLSGHRVPSGGAGRAVVYSQGLLLEAGRAEEHWGTRGAAHQSIAAPATRPRRLVDSCFFFFKYSLLRSPFAFHSLAPLRRWGVCRHDDGASRSQRAAHLHFR